MYEQEKDRLSHLIILTCYTLFSIILSGEAFLLDWNKGAVILLLLGVVACWVLHITGKIPAEYRIWTYYILSMLAFFFYGSHRTSVFDMAPVMIMCMLLYSMAERAKFITCCVGTYYMTMLYVFLVECEGNVDFDILNTTRILLHLVVVYSSGYLIIVIMRRRKIEQKNYLDKISELEEINHRTEQFLTNVSHELRTPINVVTGITTVMIKNEKDKEKRRDIISIQNAGQRLFQQIEDILDYTELDTGRIKISRENYMMSSIINDIISEEQARDRAHDLELVFDLDPSVPASLVGDGRKIKKMIRHLLDNAIKFTKEGGVYVRISTVNKSYGVNLCIQIKDTGIGVGEEQLDKIREKFYQSRNGKMRRAGGLGLGLSIVYGMTMAMEGFIRIESKEGEGTTVIISIPQQISGDLPCMDIENRTDLFVACYIKTEKYSNPQVRDFLQMLVSHLAKGLEVPLHKTESKEDLKKLISFYRLSHLVLGEEEYIEDKVFYDRLAEQMIVIVATKDGSCISAGSRVKVVKKPFYTLSVVNALNSGEKEKEENVLDRHILCPGLKVLVVDDEPMNLMVAEGIFKEYRMEVTTAESGMAAVEQCKKERYDLIFLDHMMPEMDGIETLKLLRKLSSLPGKELTVIAFTANAVSGAREMFRQAGFDEFVSKPIEDTELERVLKKVLPRAAYIYADEEGGTNLSAAAAEDMEKFAVLKEHGINVRAGVNYCRGDEAFYLELLAKFAQEAEKKQREMKRFLEEEDCDNYRICVHALKSTSKMIGAEAFSEMAKRAENAAKNHDIDYIRSHYEEISGVYMNIVRCIGQELKKDTGAATEEHPEITKEDLRERLEELQKSLSTFEAEKAEELLKALEKQSYQGTDLSTRLSEIRQDIENFDFGECSEKVAALLEKIEGSEA